jgi:ADP-ribosylglycohydrolase
MQILLGSGAVIGDIIGSTRERENIKSVDFELLPSESRMTDDSILTIATMAALNQNFQTPLYSLWYRKNYRLYPKAGFGKGFRKWAEAESMEPNDSWGNGSAMRVGPIGLVYPNLRITLEEAELSASITHANPEGVKGAKAIAGAVYLARTCPQSNAKEQIRKFITDEIGYNLDFTLDSIRDDYQFDVSCQGSVPQAINAFLESTSFESAIRLAISIGGDSDTIAAMAGSIAEPFWGIDQNLFDNVFELIKHDKYLLDIMTEFDSKFNTHN